MEDSNAAVYAQFNRLIWYAVRSWQRTNRLNEEDTQDLYGDLLIKIFQSPASYRNRRGISLMIHDKLANLIKPVNARRTEREKEQSFDKNTLSNHPKVDFETSTKSIREDCLSASDSMDLDKIKAKVGILTSSERAVLSLAYGLDGAKPFNKNKIARKLGRDIWWVNKYLSSAVMKIQRALGLKETLVALHP